MHRFLGRAWRLVVGMPLVPGGSFPDHTLATDTQPSREQLRTLHQCINKVSIHDEGKKRASNGALRCVFCWKGFLLILWALQVTEEIEGMRFNTAISAMMEFINAATKVQYSDLAL